MSIRGVTLLLGDPPVPADDVVRALESVEIATVIGERGRFRLVFDLRSAPGLVGQLLSDTGPWPERVILVIADGDRERAVMDGVMTRRTLVAAGPAARRLVVDGEDLTLLMDLVDRTGTAFPAMPGPARVELVLQAYAALGIVAHVAAPIILDVPLPAERIPHQRGTDYAYVCSLADEVGFRFTLDPGPQPGMSIARWGPALAGTTPESTLNVAAPGGVVEELKVTLDPLEPLMPEVLVLEPRTKLPVPIPVPDVGLLVPRLGAVPVPARRVERLRDVAKLTPTRAAAVALAACARSADALRARGTLNLRRAGAPLRVGTVVALRGVGEPLDGRWGVTRVVEELAPASHRQRFVLARSALGSEGDEVAA